MNDTAFADTPVSRCTYYRRTCGLPAGIEPEAGRIVVTAGFVGGVTMPATLGRRVRDEMLFQGGALGPVVDHVRSRRWTFLCRPDVEEDADLRLRLLRLDVSVVARGGEIVLPSPTDTGFRRWVNPPRDTFRPSGARIVALALACAGVSRCRPPRRTSR
ncbi:hypothetical protein SAMN04244553_6255 [Nocardia amikacinitolerans]|uniref:DNA-directed RNA polymerase subunit beta n=1 Tax=Nocardia amikacinitolerans TaxID=756689 RepID=A0A285LWG1_9NOCA|nr:DNA-directed RNA polymerase subunit beta [Nocardia amikacinitolerans]MCP2315873.1 hypothetical protein [Nocardia amikacinitolerans]SNY89248.1 hypothetical protein SAMN04244553_6255 [Nocardia amikacinitolerans]